MADWHPAGGHLIVGWRAIRHQDLPLVHPEGNIGASSACPVTSDLTDVEFVADQRADPTVAALELKVTYAAMRELPPALRETLVAVVGTLLPGSRGTILSRLYVADDDRVASG